MVKLNERHHAFISATFYRELRERGLENFEAAFLFATRKYAEERGGRMAQRALRDGRPLDFAAYRWYGEWTHTPEYLAGLAGEKVIATEEDGCLQRKILNCPWSDQYLEMGLVDGANAYCSVLDASIARGFNPALTYEVTHVMHDARDYCIHLLHAPQVGAEAAWGPQDPANLRDFNYHCGHIYWTFARTLSAIYGAEGEVLAARVLLAFHKAYGAAAADLLAGFGDTRFEYI